MHHAGICSVVLHSGSSTGRQPGVTDLKAACTKQALTGSLLVLLAESDGPLSHAEPADPLAPFAAALSPKP